MLWVPKYRGNGRYEFFLDGNVDTRQLMLNVAVATLAGALLCNLPWRRLNPFRFKWFRLAVLFVIPVMVALIGLLTWLHRREENERTARQNVITTRENARIYGDEAGVFEAQALRFLVENDQELDYDKANFKVVEESLEWAAERWRDAGNTTRADKLDALRANLGAVTPQRLLHERSGARRFSMRTPRRVFMVIPECAVSSASPASGRLKKRKRA